MKRQNVLDHQVGPGALIATFACALLLIRPLSAEVRSYDGTGNNLSDWQMGAAETQFSRLDPVPHYEDQFSTPAGSTRPNARDISNIIGRQTQIMPDPRNLSDYVWSWGQFLDHDITLKRTGTDPMPIVTTEPDDPLAPMIPFARSSCDPATGGGVGSPRQQMNDTTSFIDASMVYGTDTTRADTLRTFVGGRLAMSEGDLLPFNTSLLPNENAGSEPADSLFLAGDPRANEQIGLIALHTLFVREHNYLAGQLATENPDWDDEQIFQHARRTVGAEIQSITYNEYLPALMGDSAPDPYSATYDANTDASISNEFATAIFRLGHTEVSPEILRLQDDGTPAPGGPQALADTFFSPSFFASGLEVDYLLKGLAFKGQQRTDPHVIDTLRNALFGPPGMGGMDILSMNIQRGRDHGLPSYNELREALPGVSRAASFAEITDDPAMQDLLASIYRDVDDVDLWIGAMSENALPSSALGELLHTVVHDQFYRTMVGDRFFYLWDEELSQAEKDTISNTTLADVVVRNTTLSSLPANVFFVPEPTAIFTVLLALSLLLGWFRAQPAPV